MFDRIKRFMQDEDPNGDWLDTPESEKPYVRETLQSWANDGLEVTPKVQKYMDYLEDEQR